MQNNNSTTAAQKLLDAQDMFELLKNNLGNFDIQKQLELASSIRDNVVNDSYIINDCKENQELTNLRKQLLDQIKCFQKNLIDNVVVVNHAIDCGENVRVLDFKAANKALFNIAVVEKSRETDYTDDLYTNINEYKDHITTLNRIIKQGASNEYKVLLMGEYQSGKTTLMDSIIGRHIGAIGDGNTTSAVPIAISYGDNVKINVLWKSKEHLINLLSFIKKYIKDFSFEKFDIENKNERAKLYQELNTFRHDSYCPKAKEPGLKILALCSLVLKFYDDPRLQNIAQETIKLTYVHKISRFPKRLETRWRKKGGEDFTFEESVFAFVEKIHCFLPSESLKQLNCTLVDSPGLFSNDYDTKVTEKEMLNANAILYLLPYDKEVGEDTCGSLYILLNNYTDILRKLFIVNNRCLFDHKQFFKENRETIKEMFGPKMDLYKIDARLAYLGVLKNTFDAGNLSNEEIEQFICSCQHEFDDEEDTIRFNTFMDAWEYSLYMYKMRFHWNETPTADEIIDKSNLKYVLYSLLKFIDDNRAYSIIVSEGISKLSDELSSIRKSLKMLYVDPYIEGRDKTEEIWRTRLSRANAFEESAKLIVNSHLFESFGQLPPLSRRLSDGIYSKVFTDDNINELVINICREVYNNKWDLTKCGKNESKIKELIAPKIETVVTDFIIKRVSYWNDLIKYGQDASFTGTFVAQINLLENELNSKWKELFEKDDADFASARGVYYKVSRDTSCFALESSQEDQKYSTGRVSFMGSLLNDIAVIIAAILVLLVPTIVSIILTVVSNPAGWVAGTVVAAFGAGYYAFTGDDWMEKKFINTNAPKIKSKLIEQKIETKLSDFIFKKIKEVLNAYASTLTLNKKRIESDRDVYLSSPKEIIEHRCFASIKDISYVDDHLKKYVEFVKQYVEYAEN